MKQFDGWYEILLPINPMVEEFYELYTVWFDLQVTVWFDLQVTTIIVFDITVDIVTISEPKITGKCSLWMAITLNYAMHHANT